MGSLIEALEEVATALEKAGVRYLIGGSVASSARGVARSTMDVDLLAEMREADAGSLAAALGKGWYADEEAMRAALRLGRPFNVIDMRSGQKFDVFPAVSEFHRSELERATLVPIGVGKEAREFPVASREDILLAKLVWYRQGGQVSERQWGDITGLLEAGGRMDRGYLREWGKRLKVEDLLERAGG